jgi:hypothetical protein
MWAVLIQLVKGESKTGMVLSQQEGLLPVGDLQTCDTGSSMSLQLNN